MPPDAERTLRLTVTPSYFVVGRSSPLRSVRGLLRFGAVTVTLVLEDLLCAALWRSGDRRKPQHSVAPYRSDCDRMINAYLRCRRHRSAQNLGGPQLASSNTLAMAPQNPSVKLRLG